jgi:hypothetical protein
MALRPEEIDRIKYELGVPVTRVGAEPYISYVAVFDRAIQPYLYDASTTSSTAVTAAPAGALVSITLAANPAAASGVGLTFQAGSYVVVDVGPAEETTVLQSITGLVAQCYLVNAHVGTYGVWPQGAEWIVRNIVDRIDAINTQLQTVAPQTAGMTKVDEIEFSSMSQSGSRRGTADKFQALIRQREQARDDLGEAVGFPNLRSATRRGGRSFELY